jgi:putative ABC transport system ATP-binding protein
MLEEVGLGDRLTHNPTELCGGQDQRVAIARALVINPAILLADEPTGNLDSRNGEEVLGLLDEIRRERGVTLLLATHSAAAAARADRTVAMKDGRLSR